LDNIVHDCHGLAAVTFAIDQLPDFWECSDDLPYR
jgi:hypothetical protein